MFQNGKILVGKGEHEVCLLPALANRHGLIAGATGTGKTVTLKVLAESFSEMGVPVFLADIKGDISGMALPGTDSPKIVQRVQDLNLQGFSFHNSPVRFWDVFGEFGHPVRTTISEMGPVLLARLLNLTQVQEGVLNIVFRIADDRGLLLIDLKDLRAMLQYVGDRGKEFTTDYGNVSKQSVGAIQRALLGLEDAGGDLFFGEPNLQIADWIAQDAKGRGIVNILHGVELFHEPLIYSTFILWLLSELFENLPEVGDLEKPKMVFFFDEAHLLFTDAPRVLVQKVEQVVKLIRSKGVGVYFITQSPADIPDSVLAQLANRVQHALRAYTPAEQKAVRAAASAFRVNPNFNTEEVLTQLGTGEALVSFLDESGRPNVVERAVILPPACSFGIADEALHRQLISSSPFFGKYERAIDRESAYEILQREEAAAAKREAREERKVRNTPARRTTSRRKSPIQKATDSAATTIGRELGKSILRGIMGIFKK